MLAHVIIEARFKAVSTLERKDIANRVAQILWRFDGQPDSAEGAREVWEEDGVRLVLEPRVTGSDLSEGRIAKVVRNWRARWAGYVFKPTELSYLIVNSEGRCWEDADVVEVKSAAA